VQVVAPCKEKEKEKRKKIRRSRKEEEVWQVNNTVIFYTFLRLAQIIKKLF
jgi:hypothetical protein